MSSKTLTAKCFVASKISLHYITMLFDFSKGYLNVLVSLFRVPRAPFCDSFPAFSLVPARFFLGLARHPVNY
jgi:hypothetical protein